MSGFALATVFQGIESGKHPVHAMPWARSLVNLSHVLTCMHRGTVIKRKTIVELLVSAQPDIFT